MIRSLWGAVALLSLFASPAHATGMKLFDTICLPKAGGEAYRLTYWSSSAPGGPASFHLDISRGPKRVQVGVSRHPQLVGDAILLLATQAGGESGIVGNVVLYARENVSFLDVQLSGEGAALNTKAPTELVCRKADKP